MNRQQLIKLLKHPIILIIGSVLTTLGALIACWTITLSWLGHIDLGMPFGEPYMLTGEIARRSIEAFVKVSLADGRDFYHYYSVTPGESHDLMRFTVPPMILDRILANPSILCFGSQLQSQSDKNAITFMTPVPPYKSDSTSVSTPRPTPDYTWLTPPAGHSYKGASCTMKKGKSITYYRIRVDESDSILWVVWLEVYAG